MKVTFGALPGAVFSAPIPKPDGTAVPYSQMRVGSDNALPLADPFEIEVEAVAGELPVITAYRVLLRQVVRATYDEFQKARELVVEQQEIQL